MLLSRVITALVALPGLIALILWSPEWGYLLFVAVVAVVGHLELEGILRPGASRWRQAWGVALGVLFTAVYYGAVRWERWDVLAILFPATVIAVMALTLFRPGKIDGAGEEMSLRLFGVLYGGVLIAYLGLLRTKPQGPELVLLALLVTWSADTGAYFAGRSLGKHKLYPKVSPGKTWEGAVGGLLAAVGGTFLAKYWFLPELSLLECVIVAVPATVLGVVGDLCESLLKRAAGVKDSGKILPGHGGLLDRIDALLFTLPYLYALADWVIL